MRENIINIDGHIYKQVQKRTAKRIYDEGKTVYIIPCKMCIESPWYSIGWSIMPNEASYLGNDKPCHEIIQELYPFERCVNNFTYYNCNAEMGLYPHFYIEV